MLDGCTPEQIKRLETKAKEKLSLWPLGMRNLPEVKIAAEIMVVNEGLLKILVDQHGQLAGKRIVARTAANAGPVNVNVGAGGGNGKVGDAVDAFKRLGL